MNRNSVVKDGRVVMVGLCDSLVMNRRDVSGFVVHWNSGVVGSHRRCVMRSLVMYGSGVVDGLLVNDGLLMNYGGLVVDGGLVNDGLLMNDGGLVVDGGLNFGSDMRSIVGDLFSHEFLIHSLRNFDILDSVLFFFVNSLNNRGCVSNGSGMNGNRNLVRGSLNVSNLRLIHATLLRDLNISRTRLVARLLNDIADWAFSVSGLLNITGLSVHWLTDVAWLSILRSHDVCIVRSVSFFGRGVSRSKSGANERKSSHFAKCCSSLVD